MFLSTSGLEQGLVHRSCCVCVKPEKSFEQKQEPTHGWSPREGHGQRSVKREGGAENSSATHFTAEDSEACTGHVTCPAAAPQVGAVADNALRHDRQPRPHGTSVASCRSSHPLTPPASPAALAGQGRVHTGPKDCHTLVCVCARVEGQTSLHFFTGSTRVHSPGSQTPQVVAEALGTQPVGRQEPMPSTAILLKGEMRPAVGRASLRC